MATVKVGLNMKAALYKNSGQTRPRITVETTTRVLEQAVEHFIQFVAPSQGTVRPEIMAHARKWIEKNRKLLLLLAK